MASFGRINHINTNESWLGKIEGLRLEKTNIKNFPSLEDFKNLRDLEIKYSSFENTTLDVNKLKCLNRLEVVYSSDFKEINLANMPCLKFLVIKEPYNRKFPAPKNFEKSNLTSVDITIDGLSKEETKILNEHQEKINSKNK